MPLPVDYFHMKYILGILNKDNGDADRLVKNEFLFYQRNSQLSISVQYANGSKTVLGLNTQRQRSTLDGRSEKMPLRPALNFFPLGLTELLAITIVIKII